jgi:hypothetical protein
MNTLNIFYFLTWLLDAVVTRIAPRTLFAERLYWLYSDVRLLRRVMRIVRKAERLQPYSSRPGTRGLTDCMIARAARILGYWQYHRPMNHAFVMADMCDVHTTALRLAPDVWLNALRDGWQHAFDTDMYAAPTEAEQNAEIDAFLASQYVDDELPVTEEV